jgi:hypothetical protein
MTANYKRKRLIEENCLDAKPSKIRKNLNSSERIKARSQIVKSINDRHGLVRELRWELETENLSKCHQNEFNGPHIYMERMLSFLGVGEFCLYECKCKNYDTYSDEEILKMFGL